MVCERIDYWIAMRLTVSNFSFSKVMVRTPSLRSARTESSSSLT